MTQARGKPHGGTREVAVIDIGSNSVRLVVYRLDGRAMIPILNEKVMAGLGRAMPETGALSPVGVENALRVLKRFDTIVECIDLDRVDVVATAAVRDSTDGAEFADRVRRETGLKLRILSGEEEARLSALGVLAGAPEANGVVGDLGGSSLELISITPKGPERGESFALGPFALMERADFNAARVEAAVDAALSKTKVLKRQGGAFYAVGGAWRALGRIDIALKRHPLHVLQHYEMPRAEVLRVTEFVRKQSRKSLEKLEEAAARRADSLPYAAIVLERVLSLGGFDRVVLSSYGLREGVLFEQMDAEAHAQHPLIATAEAFGAQVERSRAFCRALATWIRPAFKNQPAYFSAERDALLRDGAARLADVGGPLHPDQRAELIFDLVLRAPLAGVSHRERAFLAASVHHRYTKTPPDHAEAFQVLLSEDERRAASAVGAALRLGADISGRTEEVLSLFRLSWERGVLTLSAPQGQRHVVNETAGKRLEALGAAIGAPVRISA